MPLTRADLEKNAQAREDLPQDKFKSTIERAVTANDPKGTAPSTNEQKLSRGAKRFPWILKNWKRKQVMYDGDPGFVNETIEPYYASRRYEANRDNQRDVKETFFGDSVVFNFFMLSKHNPDDEVEIASAIESIPSNAHKATKDLAEFLGLLAANRILKEKNFRVWQTLLGLYDLYEIENPDPLPNKQFFVRKLNVNRTFDNMDLQHTITITTPAELNDPTLREKLTKYPFYEELHKEYEIISKIDDESTQQKNLEKLMHKVNKVLEPFAIKNRDNTPEWEKLPLKEAFNFPAIQGLSITEIQELCAMKDFLEGKIKFKPTILKGKMIEQPYQNVTLTTQRDPTHNEPVKLYGHYTSSVRFAMFGEEKYYKRIRPGQTLQPWQWIAKLYTGWVTSVVAARRSGKSYRAIDEAVEMFTADTQERSRPIRVLFVGINTKKLKTVIKYLLSFTKGFTKAGYFDWESSKNIMHYRKKESAKKATDADDLGTIEFIGSKDEDAGVGDYADLIIIDECERIDENVREDILPIITNEGARAILISTLNKNSQKTWFYQQLVQGETEELQRNLLGEDVVTVIRSMRAKRVQPTIDKVTKIQEETGKEVPFEEWINWIDIDAMSAEMRYKRQRVGLRFTGEDSDLKTEKEKAFARDRLRGTKAYYPERRAIFPEDTGVYDYESSMKDESYFQGKQYKYVVLAYDPAESKDKAALVYMGYDSINRQLEIFRTEKLPNNYTYHGPFIANTLKECEQRVDKSLLPPDVPAEHRVYFAYDFNGVGQGLEPFFQECGVRIDMKLRFTGQGGINKKGTNHNVPKEVLVNMLQNVMDHGALVINSECKEFIEELGHYKSYYNPDTGNTKYQAERGASDDFVSAAMIGTYFILEYMGEKFNITKNEIEQAIDPDADHMSIDDMFKEVEKIVMQGVNSGKTAKQVIDEYNGRSQRNSLKRQDVLSQFGY